VLFSSCEKDEILDETTISTEVETLSYSQQIQSTKIQKAILAVKILKL